MPTSPSPTTGSGTRARPKRRWCGPPARRAGPCRLETVDVDTCNDESGGFNVGGVFPGEWLAYTVEVEQAGAYDVSVRLSAPGTGSKLHIEFAGKDATGPVDVPDTGAWGNWRTVT